MQPFRVDLEFSDVDNIMNQLQTNAPVSFGYRTNWLAAQHQAPNSIAAILGLSNLAPASWNDGLQKSEEGSIFISPEIFGWTFIVGQQLPDGRTPLSQAKLENIMAQLSEKGEAVFFANQPDSGYFAWAKADLQRIIRAYAYSSLQEEVCWSRGVHQVAELGLNLPSTIGFSSIEEEMGLDYPDEEMVMALSEKLSINPAKLSTLVNLQEKIGWTGYSS